MALRRATFRLYPNKQVSEKLSYHRQLHKDLYNAAISNRITSYKKFGKSVSYFEQQNCLPDFKEVWTEYKEINSQALQATLKPGETHLINKDYLISIMTQKFALTSTY